MILAVQTVADLPVLLGLGLAGLGSIVAARLARPWLRAHEAFPRLMKLRVIGSIVGRDR